MRMMACTRASILAVSCLGIGAGCGDDGNGDDSTPGDDGTADGVSDDPTGGDDSDTDNGTGTDTGTEDIPAQAFRFTEMYIRDPHFFVLGFSILCVDATDDVPTGESINDQFNNGIQMDDPEEPDGFLDLSFLTLFRPEADPTSSGGTMEIAMGQCTVPEETTVCTVKPGTELTPATFTNEATEDCLAPIPADLSGENYSPQPQTTTAPCLRGTTPSLRLDFSDFALDLIDVEFGAKYPATAGAGLTEGLLRGFLTEEVADATILPASLDEMVAGKPISELMPGGTNCCAEHDDRDINNGVSGWWIYVDFVAEPVPWTDL